MKHPRLIILQHGTIKNYRYFGDISINPCKSSARISFLRFQSFHLHTWRLIWGVLILHSDGRAVLIIIYPWFSHALYLDSSKNMKKKDYTHIKSVLDSAIFTYGIRGGEIKTRKTRNRRPAFGHKTDFCCIQQSSGTLSDGLFVVHHMLEYI